MCANVEDELLQQKELNVVDVGNLPLRGMGIEYDKCDNGCRDENVNLHQCKKLTPPSIERRLQMVRLKYWLPLELVKL